MPKEKRAAGGEANASSPEVHAYRRVRTSAVDLNIYRTNMQLVKTGDPAALADTGSDGFMVVGEATLQQYLKQLPPSKEIQELKPSGVRYKFGAGAGEAVRTVLIPVLWAWLTQWCYVECDVLQGPSRKLPFLAGYQLLQQLKLVLSPHSDTVYFQESATRFHPVEVSQPTPCSLWLPLIRRDAEPRACQHFNIFGSNTSTPAHAREEASPGMWDAAFQQFVARADDDDTGSMASS